MTKTHSDVRVSNRNARLTTNIELVKRQLEEVHALQLAQLEKRRLMETQQETLREKSEAKFLAKQQAQALKKQPKLLKANESQMKKVGLWQRSLDH